MSTAIYVKTESGDDYLWAAEKDLTPDEVKDLLKKDLDDEYDYISEIDVRLSNGDYIDVDVPE